MRIYISIHRGPGARDATPIMATGDEEVVAATLDAVARRLGVDLRAEGQGHGSRPVAPAATPVPGAGR